MTNMADVRDLRFEGMDIPQLVAWIEQIKEGRGPESLDAAARALEKAVQVVVDLDSTLRTELGKLHVEWEGHAGSMAQEATQRQTAVMQESQDPLKTSSTSVQNQGHGYSTAKNGLPNPGELRHQQSENVLEWGGGAFGYESDYDKEAKQIDSNTKVAQAALGSYRDTTVQQADAYRPLPEMPPATVTSQAASQPGVAGVNAGFATPGTGGGGGYGAGSDEGLVAGSSGGGTGGSGSSEAERGGRSGNGGNPEDTSTGGGADRDPHDDPKEVGIGANGVIGLGAGGALVAGLGALAAGRLLGGNAGSAEPARGPVAARGGSSAVGGGPGDTSAGRTAGRAPSSKPPAGSMMGPAATRDRQGDGDDEHENKYVVEETHFDDNRLVAPPVLGDGAPNRDEDSDDAEKQD